MQQTLHNLETNYVKKNKPIFKSEYRHKDITITGKMLSINTANTKKLNTN